MRGRIQWINVCGGFNISWEPEFLLALTSNQDSLVIEALAKYMTDLVDSGGYR
jgi:diaminopimelate decarboxylase